jgi:dipeptidase E
VQTVILGSDRFDTLPGLLNRRPADTPVLYVPTAAEVLDEEQDYVAEEPRLLAAMGFPVTTATLTGASPERVAKLLDAAGLVFVTGGSPFYLLHQAMLSGFTDIVPPLVRGGALVYVGISAGAYLATPDLLPVVSQATRSTTAPDLATTTAMGLVPFSVIAHYGDPARADRHRALLESTQVREIVPVTNEQLIVVRGTQRAVVPAVR